MSSWHSYGSIYNVGHKAVSTILEGHVVVEEKIDGSQFSFGVIDGRLRVRSKGKEIELHAPEKLFTAAVETAARLAGQLRSGWTYRGEYLQKPKHNVLAYDRIPKQHIILFDIARDEEDYLTWHEKNEEAQRLGLEVVPLFWNGDGRGVTEQAIKEWAARASCLGGQQNEGVVIKAYGRFGLDKKTLMAKYVREEFKEVHRTEWKRPTRADLVEEIGARLRMEARWLKAIQHLREAGVLTDSPRDIGPLIKEIKQDVVKECREQICDWLFDHFEDAILAQATKGLPQWYKDKLLARQFDEAR